MPTGFQTGHLIDLDFRTDDLGRSSWRMGPDPNVLANSIIKHFFKRALARFIRNGHDGPWSRRVWIRGFRSFGQTHRRMLLAFSCDSCLGSPKHSEYGLKQFKILANMLQLQDVDDIGRMIRHSNNQHFDFWYVIRDNINSVLSILSTAIKVRKYYDLFEHAPKHKDLQRDTISVIKHISSLTKLLNRMDSGWFEIVSEQDGKHWGDFISIMEQQLLERIDSFQNKSISKNINKKQLSDTLDDLASKFFYALLNLNQKEWKSSGTIFHKLIGSEELFLVSKSLLLIEKYIPHQEEGQNSKSIAAVADALKAFSLGPSKYRGTKNGDPIQWAQHHITLARKWRARLQEALELLNWIHAEEASGKAEGKEQPFLACKRWEVMNILRGLMQGPGYSMRADLLGDEAETDAE